MLSLINDAPSGSINDYVSYYLETDGAVSLNEITQTEFSEKFAPTETEEPVFGFQTNGIWLSIAMRNDTPSDQERIVILHTNFMREIAAYWVTSEKTETLLEQNAKSVFSTRRVPYHELAAPMVIPGGAEGRLYIHYSSEGNTTLPISLETPLSFALVTARRVTIDFVFYGVMAMFIIASIAGRMFWRNNTFVAYSLYAASVLLYIFQRDGYAFQYLWPNVPVWNNLSSLPLGASLPVFAAIFTRSYLQTKTIHPALDKVLIGVILAQAAVIGSAFVIGQSEAKKIALLSTTLSVIIFFMIGVIAYRKYGGRTIFFVAGWFGLLCASIIMSVAHWIESVNITRAMSLDVMRVSMVFDAFMMGLASVFSIVDLQKEREQLDKERIAVLNNNLTLHHRLARLEQKYHLAQTLAETNSRRLVDTTHDLRQPLYALRSAISEALSQKSLGSRAGEIEHSFDYIEELVEAALKNAIDEDEAGRGLEQNQPETIEVSKVFSALQTMFEADAKTQSIDFKIIPTSLDIKSRPFPILRIMSNFVSNAIRYGANGRVLVGVKRRGGDISLEVHDTGPGMTEQELSLVAQRYVRGEAADKDSAGMGVGLSIVAKLAQEEGLRWSLESEKGRGTVARLFVPTR
ncbi:MAG: sensor histidine kinase [Parvularculaceae bacterium]